MDPSQFIFLDRFKDLLGEQNRFVRQMLFENLLLVELRLQKSKNNSFGFIFSFLLRLFDNSFFEVSFLPHAEELELHDGFGALVDDVMSCLILQLAVFVPLKDFECSSHLQKSEVLLSIDAFINPFHKVLKQRIKHHLECVLIVNHGDHSEEHLSLLFKQSSLRPIVLQKRQKALFKIFLMHQTGLFFQIVFTSFLHAILVETPEHFFVLFKLVKSSLFLVHLGFLKLVDLVLLEAVYHSWDVSLLL